MPVSLTDYTVIKRLNKKIFEANRNEILDGALE